MGLRSARPEDDAAITAITRRAMAGPSGRPDTSSAETDETTVVAEQDGQVVGWTTVAPSADLDVGLVRDLVVDPDHRGRGHGRQLLTSARRILTAQGRSRAEIQVPAGVDGEPPAMPLALGWVPATPTGPTPPTPAPGADQKCPLVRLVLDLQPEDSVTANRASWDDMADSWVGAGRRSYQPERRKAPTWGIFAIPEAEVGLLADVAGQDVVELGCGTGYVSAWCLEAGARSAVGIDNSPAQLATAAALQAEFGVHFPLVWASAEMVPLAGSRFDLVISEYGAAIWADPYRWLPEAARLLRPGGRLVFLGNSILATLCVQDYELEGTTSAHLQRPLRGLHRVAFPDTMGIEYHLPHGEMIRLLRSNGFEILDLMELYAPDDASSAFAIDAEWARHWPAEDVWIAERVR